MKNTLLTVICALLTLSAGAREFNPVPRMWKWVSERDVVFTFDGTFEDSTAFMVNVRTGKRVDGVKYPRKYSDFPVKPEGAVKMVSFLCEQLRQFGKPYSDLLYQQDAEETSINDEVF